MSLITRCPACGTMFKVVPDQLRISEGWVRCGHCAEVFDAQANMQADDEVGATATEPPASQLPADSEGFESSLNTEVGASIIDPPDSAQLEEEAKSLSETPLDQPFEMRRPDVASAAEARPSPAARPTEPEPELHDLSFVRQARRQAFWRGGAVRAVLFIVFLALGALLLAQVALHDRDRLAAAEPALRPWLARLCEPLSCRIGPPRQIDAIAIESSSFNKLRGEAYRLNFTVKNQAPIEVAMPSLELTLTDAQDQPVLRRVLSPAELGTVSAVISAASDITGSLTLAVAPNGAGPRIAGYRLLAFYP
ncbi:MAG TPA: DUF3426 domain-containing protein [Ramlibacter sp.]|nr:DUF3426 domain-containing protein [Ramlibacter sp.]